MLKSSGILDEYPNLAAYVAGLFAEQPHAGGIYPIQAQRQRRRDGSWRALQLRITRVGDS